MSEDFDIIIIGAGISGLTSAYQLLLLNPNYRLLLLEANSRVGGRTLTRQLRVADGKVANFDMGGMWIGPNQQHINSLLQELGIEVYEQFLQGKKLAEIGGRVAEYAGDMPYIGVLGLMDLGKTILQLERCVRQVPAAEPAHCSQASRYDSISGQALINGFSWSSSTKHLVAAAARAVWGAELSRMSALYLLVHASSAGSFSSLVSSDASSGQGYRIKGGAFQICQRLAERLGSDRIHLNSPVTCIDQSNPNQVSVSVGDGQQLTAKVVISSLPPNQLQHITFTPPLPQRRMELCKSSVTGHLIKFVVTYQSAFWRELGYSGEIVSSGGAPTAAGCSCAPISVSFDNCAEEGQQPALVLLSGGVQAMELDGLGEEQRRDAVLQHLARFYPEEKVMDFIDFAEMNWRQQPFSGGCPVDFVTTGAAAFMGNDSRAPVGRLLTAGTESATEWIGFMDGAVQSAARAAREAHTLINAD